MSSNQEVAAPGSPQFSTRRNLGNSAKELVEQELEEYLQAKGIQSLMDEMLASLLVHKPKYPYSPLVEFVAQKDSRQFRRALHDLDEPIPSTVYSDDSDPDSDAEDGLHRSRLPLSAHDAHAERTQREAAAAAAAEALETRRDAEPVAAAVERGQREVLLRVASDYGLDAHELIARLIEGKDIPATKYAKQVVVDEGAGKDVVEEVRGKEAVGRRVSVFWPGEEKWF